MLTITTHQGDEFDLLPGSVLSIEETSVLFSRKGSYSLPLELPPTDNNLFILSRPDRLDRRTRFPNTLEVIVASGVWRRRSTMHVESAGKNHAVTISLYFKESPFYQAVEGKMLPDIFNGIKRDDYSGHSDPLPMWRQHFNKVMTGSIYDDFYVFPVVARITDIEESIVSKDGTEKQTTTWAQYIIFNRTAVPDDENPEGTNAQTNNGKAYYTLADTAKIFDAKGGGSDLPDGYGWVPFLKFGYVIHYLFNYFGYELAVSHFDTEESFKRMCLVNNTGDAVVRGFIEYKQLLPDVSVNDFLTFLENSFGVRFVIDEVHKAITPIFYEDVLSALPSSNYAGVYEDFPKIEYVKGTCVRLTINRAVEQAAPLRFSSIAEMTARYGPIRYIREYDASIHGADTSGLDGLFFVQKERRYMLCRYFRPDPLNFPARFVQVNRYIEVDTLDYYEPNKDSYQDIPLNFDASPLIDTPLRGLSAKRVAFEINKKWLPKEFASKIEELLGAAYSESDGMISKCPYIGTLRNLNSVIQKTKTSNDETAVSFENETEVQCPIIPMQFVGFSTPDARIPNIEKTVFGSQHQYDNEGYRVGTFDLTTRSLHEKFWAKYDAALQTSFHRLTGAAQLPDEKIMSPEMASPKIYDGQKILLESMKYEVSAKGVEVVDLVSRVVGDYE